MQLFIIRHFEPEIQKGICYGSSNIVLKKIDKSQINNTLTQIDLSKINVIYSSPLDRCKNRDCCTAKSLINLAQPFDYKTIMLIFEFNDKEPQPYEFF